MFCLIIILVQIALLNCQGFELIGKELFNPAITKCVIRDIYNGPFLNSTTCDNRSNGCNYDTKNCILSQILGYTLGNFMNIQPTIMSAIDTIHPDAKINVTVSYLAPSSIFGIRGFLQLWQFVSINPLTNVDVYKFTYRQEFVSQLPLQTKKFTFNGLTVGKYIIAFWDTGGTRFGLGDPEVTTPFVISSVFPSPIADLGLEVSIVQQRRNFEAGTGPCINVNFLTNNMYVQYVYSKYYNIWTGNRQDKTVYFSVEIRGKGNIDLTSYIENAETMHNRKFVWLWQSDMGNVIDVKTEAIRSTTGKYNCTYCNNPATLNMTTFCNTCNSNLAGFSSPACASCALSASPTFCGFCGGITGGKCNTEVEIQNDGMLKFKVAPIITGSYGITTGEAQVADPAGDNRNGIFEWERTREGRKTAFSMVLGYVGMSHTDYKDYWRMRQSQGDVTVVARKIVDMVQVDVTPSWNYLFLDNSRINANASGEVWKYAHVEKPKTSPAVPEGEEWFVTYFFGRHVTRKGYMGSNGMVATYADMYYLRDLYINQPSGDVAPNGDYCRLDNQGGQRRCHLIGAELYKFMPAFIEHDNFDDFSCHPLSTDYAREKERGIQNSAGFGDPCVRYQNRAYTDCVQGALLGNPANADRFTFADIELLTNSSDGFFSSCQTRECQIGSSFRKYGSINNGRTGCYTNTLFPSDALLTDPITTTPCSGTPEECSECPSGSVFNVNTAHPDGPGCYSLIFPFSGRIDANSITCPSTPFSCGTCCSQFTFSNVWGASVKTDRGSFIGESSYVVTPHRLWPSKPNILVGPTGVERKDIVCGGFSNGRESPTTIHLGSSSLCDLVRILNMSMSGPWGKHHTDPSNNGANTGINQFIPAQQEYSSFGLIKDCASGPYPIMYRHGFAKSRDVVTRENQKFFPYHQLSYIYPTAQNAIENPVKNPIFLVPGYFSSNNPINTLDLGTPSSPLSLDTPPLITSYPGAVGENVMTVGLDTHMVSVQYESRVTTDIGVQDPVIWNVQLFASYARFKVYPHVTFLYFKNAVKARGARPATIDIGFRVKCPFLAFRTHFSSNRLVPPSQRAYCAEGWYITNQRNESITLGIKRGAEFAADSDPLSVYAYTHMVAGPYVGKTGQIISGIGYKEEFTDVVLTIAYTDFDVLHWEFHVRSEPEKPYGDSDGICHFSSGTPRTTLLGKYVYIPDMVTVAVPLQQYVFRPLRTALTIAPPTCAYNTPAAIIYPTSSSFFAWDTVYELDLPGVTSNGGTSGDLFLDEFVYYYYKWTFIGQGDLGEDVITQGFNKQIQTHSPPYTVEICDRQRCVAPEYIDTLVPAPINQNVFKRPPRCVDPTEDTWGCRVNLEEVGPMNSGITQEPFCRASADGTMRNAVLLQPLFIFILPATSAQIRSYYFNLTTPYVSPLLFSLRNIAVFEQQDQFIVDETNVPSGYSSVTLYVSFGATQQNLLESPCYEKFITDVYVPSDFVVSKGSISIIPGCSRPDNCCYFLPLTVSGSSPYTGLPVTLSGVSAPYNTPGNASDLCFGTPLCLYEVKVLPALNVDGGLCLGQIYSFTVQSPQVLVDSRVGPPVGLSNTTIFNSTNFKYAYRCPTTFSQSMPISGISPATVSTVPGPCSNRGTIAKFAFQYTDIACSGPISMANPIAACRRNLSFSLANQNGDPAYPNSAPPGAFGSGFSLSNPYIISGTFTLSYNTPGFFEFPTFYAPAQLPLGGFDAIPNGYWDAFFWVSSPLYATVIDGRLRMTTRFLASLKNSDGLSLIRTFLDRPLCPGAPIRMGMTIVDLSFRGPYIVKFTEPKGGLINSINYTCAGIACQAQQNCVDFAPELASLPTIEARRTACDQRMQTPGISLVLQVGTGAQSPGYDGGYTVSVGPEGGTCGSEYVEFMNALLELRLAIECLPTSCSRRSDGSVDTNSIGGTRKPFLSQQTILGSNLDRWIPLYEYNWTTPLGTLHTPGLLRVPEGFYSGRMCDYNGCCVDSTPATCYVNTSSAGLRLIPDKSFPGNCSGDPSRLEFRVEGDYPPFSLYRVGNKTIFVDSGYTILADRNAIPGESVTYNVINSRGCISPDVSFVSDGPIDFQLTARVEFFPCGTASATGRIIAFVSPPNLGTVLEWTNVNTGQIVYNNINDNGYPYLDNAPAGTYLVTATSVLYGCAKTLIVEMSERSPPQITVNRAVVGPSKDIVSGFITSDNGPPYTITFLGMPINVTIENQFVLNTEIVFFPTMRYSITNLVATVTFSMTVVDAGQCINTVTSLGRTITQIDVLQTPSPLPNIEFNQSEIIQQMRMEDSASDNRLMIIILSSFTGAFIIVGAAALYSNRINKI